ncbi:hypothetical protein CPAR01_05036, partial [Colletotrichum paranaense]
LGSVIESSACSTFPQPPKFSTTQPHSTIRAGKHATWCQSVPLLARVSQHRYAITRVFVPISVQSFTLCKANPLRPDSTAQ